MTGPVSNLRDFVYGPQDNMSAASSDGKIVVGFDRHEEAIINLIEASDCVVGCVAWLTSIPILNALAKKDAVSIVVQKEDFLRPDGDQSREELRAAYDALYHKTFDRFDAIFRGTDIRKLSTCGDLTIDAVRCAGNHNSSRSPAFPRAHHKFAIFGKRRPEEDLKYPGFPEWFHPDKPIYQEAPPVKAEKPECCTGLRSYLDTSNPFSQREPTEEWQAYYDLYLEWWWTTPFFKFTDVWTGSYNWTWSASRSLENAVIIRDQVIIDAYFEEYCRVLKVSEPLDWESPWCEPQWRLGT